jgi:type IV pilus assembly protein PilM
VTSVIGLDIGTSAVRAVQLSVSRRGGATLERVGQVALPPGAVRDGEVVEPETVAAAVQTLWRTFHFSGRKVALGLANQQVVVRQVDVPYMPEAELRRSLTLQAQDYVPIPIEQAVLDVHVLENIEQPDGSRISRVLLVAAQRGMVDAFLTVVRRARLEPVGLDLHAFALLRALGDQDVLDDGEGELLLDVGASVTNVVVHTGGVPRFVRILAVGGGAITDSLTGSLDMTPEEAEETKASIGIPTDHLLALEDERARIIGERASRFVEDIRNSVDYYRAQGAGVPITRAILTGGASQLPNLRERLTEALGVPVEYGRPLDKLKLGRLRLPREELDRAQPFLAVALGLALGAAA